MVYVLPDLEECETTAFRILESRPIVVGFDTETTVSSMKQTDQKISVIQIAIKYNDKYEIYIFQVYRIWMAKKVFPRQLQKILESKDIIKVGVGIEEDMIHLEKSYHFRPRGYLDIQHITKTLSIPESSLDSLAKRFLNWSKIPFHHDQNWDSTLTPSQVLYASTDAELSLRLYKELFHIEAEEMVTENWDMVKEYKLLKEWIIIMLSKSSKDIPLNSMIKQITNSYGPWRNRYVEKVRTEKAKEGILYLAELNEIQYDFTREELVKIKECNDDIELTTDEIAMVFNNYIQTIDALKHNGLKWNSLAKMIQNSYGRWANLSQGIKEQYTNKALTILQEQGKIKVIHGKVYL